MNITYISIYNKIQIGCLTDRNNHIIMYNLYDDLILRKYYFGINLIMLIVFKL